MSQFFNLLGSVWKYKSYTSAGIVFHILTALLTVLSIPLVIPFFQILFGVSPSKYSPPESWLQLEDALNYGFSRLIAISDHFIALKVVCIVVIVIFLLKNLFRFLQSYFMIYVRNALLKDLRSDIWRAYERMSLSRRYKMEKGSLLSLITNDLSEIDSGILNVFELIFKTPLIIIGSFLFMVWLSPILTLIAFLLIIFTLLVIGNLSHNLKKPAKEALEDLSAINVLADQYLTGIKLIRIHHSEGYFNKRFQDKNESLFNLANKILRRRDLASPLAEFLGVVTIVALLYYGTHQVFAGGMEPSTFFAFIFAFYNIIDPAKSFSREYANVQRGLAALDRVKSFTSSFDSESTDNQGFIDVTFKNKIELNDISYQYDHRNDLILDSVNFTIAKGERIGIVGASGSGKTTLIDLILRFYEPIKGEILLDDVKIQEIERNAYNSLFGLVTQHPSLFHGTVEENIVLDRVKDEEMLNRVFNIAGLDLSFKNQLIGDGSSMISGGEAQRVCLARVLYREPSIILMDEPTSHLDYEARAALVSRIMAIPKDMTILLVSHQSDILKDLDRIIFVENGRIADIARFEDLIKSNENFRSLVN